MVQIWFPLAWYRFQGELVTLLRHLRYMITFSKGTLPLSYLKSFRLRIQPKSFAISLCSNWITLRYKMLLERIFGIMTLFEHYYIIWQYYVQKFYFIFFIRQKYTMYLYYKQFITYLLFCNLSRYFGLVFETERLTATTSKSTFLENYLLTVSKAPYHHG